nr:PREDICTED: jacalin-related lectin 3-like [Musa acuminata subsp. malaccensis]
MMKILNGNTHTDKRGTTIGAFKEIILEEDEYFTSISGYFHALSNYQGHAIVMLLTLETNKGASINVGNKIGSSFALTLEDWGRILGFFGRAGTAIDAIGIHCSLPN